MLAHLVIECTNSEGPYVQLLSKSAKATATLIVDQSGVGRFVLLSEAGTEKASFPK